jgi:ribosomal-protein-alanine N-acetyltransferase
VARADLRTTRLILTAPAPDDAVALRDYATRNRDHLAPWSPVPARDAEALSTWRDWIEDADVLEGRGAGFSFLMWLSETLVGQATLSEIVRGPFQACYLGFSLDAAHQGKGLMREGLGAVIRFAFEALELHRIMANYQPENRRSAATLAALGFRIEGYAPAYLHIAGAWRPHVLTALTNPKPLSR